MCYYLHRITTSTATMIKAMPATVSQSITVSSMFLRLPRPATPSARRSGNDRLQKLLGQSSYGIELPLERRQLGLPVHIGASQLG